MHGSRRHCLVLLSLLALACGDEGTISFDLVFPPGTDRLPADAVTMRLTLDDQGKQVEVPIASDGSFSLALAVTADRSVDRATLDALDANGTVLVRGRSAPLPLAALSDTFVFYMAPPGQFSEAPVAFPSARSEMATASLSFGTVFAGGRDATGALLDDLFIYNIYTHAFQSGLALPEGRANMAMFAGSFGFVYMFGGEGPGGATATLWRFDSNVAPSGFYDVLPVNLSFARTASTMAPLGLDQFVITGDPVLLLDGNNGLIAPLAVAANTTNQATTATTIVSTTEVVTVFAGPTVDRFYPETVELLTDSLTDMRSEHASIRLANNEVVIVGGVDQNGVLLTTAIRVGVRAPIASVPLLSQGRRFPAVAATNNFLVVAGGYDINGVALADAEIFDASTLAPIATVPLVTARGQATATVTSNNSILLTGGKDAALGLPVLAIEIFTP